MACREGSVEGCRVMSGGETEDEVEDASLEPRSVGEVEGNVGVRASARALRWIDTPLARVGW